MALSVITLPPPHKCPLWRPVSEKQTLSLLVSVDICVILFSVFLGGERMSPLSHVLPLSALVLVEAKAQGSMNGLSSQSHQRSRGSAPSFLTPSPDFLPLHSAFLAAELWPLHSPRFVFLPNSPKFPQCLSCLLWELPVLTASCCHLCNMEHLGRDHFLLLGVASTCEVCHLQTGSRRCL